MAQASIKMLESYADLVKEAKAKIFSVAEESWSEKRQFLLGLSGGKTPGGLYKELNGSLPLSKTEFFLVDERNVNFDDHRSNHYLVKNTIFAGKDDQIQHLHDFDTALESTECLKRYSQILDQIAPEGLDMAILGIGKDGHFASIFPGFKNFQNPEKVLASTTLINEVKERYSMSPSYLFKSKFLLILLAGKDKMEAVHNLLKDDLDLEHFPAKFLLKHPRLEFIYCHESPN